MVASGEAPEDGSDAVVKLSFGKDAENKDPRACNIVRVEQVIAVKTPATRGKSGKNVFGKEISAKAGKDLDLSAGENVTLSKDKTSFTSEIYGRAEFKERVLSVKNLVQIMGNGTSAQMDIFPVVSDSSALTRRSISGGSSRC